MARTRADRKKDQGKIPTKRAARGAQQVARLDREVGVTSRSRKRKQGGERVADPRTGARPGKERSKWRPELRKRAKKPQTR